MNNYREKGLYIYTHSFIMDLIAFSFLSAFSVDEEDVFLLKSIIIKPYYSVRGMIIPNN